jgi:hypothetical protein
MNFVCSCIFHNIYPNQELNFFLFFHESNAYFLIFEEVILVLASIVLAQLEENNLFYFLISF